MSIYQTNLLMMVAQKWQVVRKVEEGVCED